MVTSAPCWAAENSRTTGPDNTLQASTSFSNEGYFVLNWDLHSASTALILEQSSQPSFSASIDRSIPASGALTITGLEDGQYYFRVTQNGSALTDPVQVSVEHHSLARAFSFFLLGLALFVTLLTVIFTGNRREAL